MKTRLLYFTLTGALLCSVCFSCKSAREDDPTPDPDIPTLLDPYYRAPSASSKATCTQVFEYTPAPGQFINGTPSGFNAESSATDANRYALRRLNTSREYVSLGGFGGYLIVGFDHSVYNYTGTDFQIVGNSFEGSSEPGIVYVMQDANGNGLPDDTWYELKGSEYGKAETITDYAVTYYKPSGDNENIRWSDNKGASGEIVRTPENTQESYYPAWITAASYTLRGVRLQSKTYQDETGVWVNGAFDWGYADNFSATDKIVGTAPLANGFDIENAVRSDGTSAGLHHIDFVKIQTGVNVQAGPLGELSTEVIGIADLKAGE